MAKNYVTNHEVEVFLVADITGGFKVVNSGGFNGPLAFYRMTNTMNVPVIISFDGVYGSEYIRSHDSITLYSQLCSLPSNKKSLLKDKTKVYVKNAGGVPKTGALIVTGFYQK